jgi:aminoglycoside phosphotransferase (APT) family kinase protein
MEEKLRAFLSSQMPEATEVAIRNLERRPGGASRESWSFDVAWKQDGSSIERRCILRRDPARSLLEADKTDRSQEFRILQAMDSAHIPVPRPYWLDTDGRWLERPSLIMERMDGQPTPLPTYPPSGDPAVREKLAMQFVEILARIHRADWRQLGLAFLGVPGAGEAGARRQVALWDDTYRKNRLEPIPILDEAFRWLRANLPSTDRITLVHGDYRSGNYLYDEAGRITAMLDWEVAHLGDPMEDLGWACMKFWNGGVLAVGLMDRDELLRRYEERSAITVDEKSVFFYEVLGNVKMATIALTGVRAFCEGTTSHLLLGMLGFVVPRLLADLVDQIAL